MRVRKRPVEVHAWRVSALLALARDDWKTLPQQIRDAYEDRKVLFLSDSVDVMTLEGAWVKGSADALIVCGIKGELYPCDAAIFDMTYEVIS